ncbi:unnamed protein product [Auanema sp. JU1783]|nr:unnamed protein product [Auanema sp. JU1783]
MSQDDTFSSASSVISEKENQLGLSEQDHNSERKYFCQRCLNHGFEHPRKGHKPHCKYAKCDCKDCSMVERRRQLNNILSKCNPAIMKTEVVNGKKSRIPCCSRCSCHGHINPLKGHKKALCPFRDCQCKTCAMVVLRRDCMAAQVKLRRGQSKGKNHYGSGTETSDDCVAFSMPKMNRGKGRIRKTLPIPSLASKLTVPSLNCNSPSPPALSPTFSLSSLSSNVSSPAPSPLLQTEFSMPTTNVTTTVTSVSTAPLPAGILIPTPLTAVPPVMNSIMHTPPIVNLTNGLPAPRAIKPMLFGELPYDLNSTIGQLSLQYRAMQLENLRNTLMRFQNCSDLIPNSN